MEWGVKGAGAQFLTAVARSNLAREGLSFIPFCRPGVHTFMPSRGFGVSPHQAWVVMRFGHVSCWHVSPHWEAFHQRSYCREKLSAVAEMVASEVRGEKLPYRAR